MTTETALKKLFEYEKTSFALGHAAGVIYYDGATVAPKGSGEVRAATLGELSRISYNLATSKETEEMIFTLMESLDKLDSVTQRKVKELHRANERTRKIPVEEYVRWQELTTKADDIWHGAKAKNDFKSFEKILGEVFDAARKLALYMEPGKHPYDTLLDMFERGLDREKCDSFFSSLKERIPGLISRVGKSRFQVDDSPLKQSFPIAKQREFSKFVMGVMGIDGNHCALGETEHPFTTSFSKFDVRMTTHYYADKFASSLYSVIHEGGHALYELNIGDNIAFSTIGGGASMAMHESMSRFYENIIGRSREFSGVILPWLKKEFSPLLDSVGEDDFYRMINKSTPSLVRIEADELTYCLHIMVRYELEKQMIEGSLTSAYLPTEWKRLYGEYLGVDVPNDTLGVLQDSHWSNGNIGYFPSYAIGSAYGAQYIDEINKDFDLFSAVRTGSLVKINKWFEEKVWRHGRLCDPDKLFESVCGSFKPDVYADYLEAKFKDIYHL